MPIYDCKDDQGTYLIWEDHRTIGTKYYYRNDTERDSAAKGAIAEKYRYLNMYLKNGQSGMACDLHQNIIYPEDWWEREVYCKKH